MSYLMGNKKMKKIKIKNKKMKTHTFRKTISG
jgi:hypothetical protein